MLNCRQADGARAAAGWQYSFSDESLPLAKTAVHIEWLWLARSRAREERKGERLCSGDAPRPRPESVDKIGAAIAAADPGKLNSPVVGAAPLQRLLAGTQRFWQRRVHQHGKIALTLTALKP